MKAAVFTQELTFTAKLIEVAELPEIKGSKHPERCADRFKALHVYLHTDNEVDFTMYIDRQYFWQDRNNHGICSRRMPGLIYSELSKNIFGMDIEAITSALCIQLRPITIKKFALNEKTKVLFYFADSKELENFNVETPKGSKSMGVIRTKELLAKDPIVIEVNSPLRKDVDEDNTIVEVFIDLDLISLSESLSIKKRLLKKISVDSLTDEQNKELDEIFEQCLE